MGYKNQKGRRVISLLAIWLLLTFNLSAQETQQADSLVRLLGAKQIQQYEESDDLIRKAISPTFLHNGTYLKCDSSLWSENKKIINCLGNVSLSQGDTELTSDKLDYFIDDNLAQFRGSVVELKDKKGNVLRTKVLDYNTRDSIATFIGGASMISEDGQIIESINGHYFNAASLFKFDRNVNMYADSIFVKTDSLLYYSDEKKAHFISYMDFFKDDDLLSSKRGWYESNRNLFFLVDSVHGQTKTQEIWADSLYFYRNTNNVLLLGNAQVQDSTRKAASLSQYLFYEDSLSKVTFKREAALALWEEREGKIDTTYIGSDVIIYQGVKLNEISDEEKGLSEKRKKTISSDPIAEFRRRASEEAAKKAAEAQKKSDEAKGKKDTSSSNNSSSRGHEVSEATPSNTDTSSLRDEVAAIQANTDTLTTIDSTEIAFITAIGKVKAYRSDMQLVGDSLIYTQLDSIARIYKEPIVWNEGRRQYTADSLFLLLGKEGIDKANLMGNAFVAVQEDSTFFDQIRSQEIMAYFDSTSTLSRFDALGGVNAIFCIEEDGVIATINKVEGRTMSAVLSNGELQRAYYFESPKNDATPAAQIAESDKFLKGYRWNPELKPSSKEDITTLVLKPSERSAYNRHPKYSFKQTNIYFPGHIAELFASLRRAKIKVDTSESLDSLSINKDSLNSISDTTATRLEAKDFQKDSLKIAVSDSLKTNTTVSDTTQYMTPKELAKALRQAARDARWAEKDKKDAARLEAKKAKEAERKAKREARKQKRIEKQEAKDQKLYEYYIEYYTKQKERENGEHQR